jgi:GH35 family endo-1,4-beta-xylanase
MNTVNFCKKHGLKIRSKPVSVNKLNPGWIDADHWHVTIRFGKKQMSTYFSKGSGHHGEPPNVAEVINCLASDSASIENSPIFQDWANEMGYDPDSRKAERIFNICHKQADRLTKFLGSALYSELVFKVERD